MKHSVALFLFVFLYVYSAQLFAQHIVFPLPIDEDFSNAITQALKPAETNWSSSNRIGLDLSEVAFVNWNSGGSNSISGLGEVIFRRDYIDRNLKWRNKFTARYGVNSQEGRELRKTDDMMEFVSNFGYRKDTLSNWFYSAKFRFQTQFSNGYRYPNTEVPISKLMAPGYVFFGVGSEYGKSMENLSVYASPLTYKSTFVLDQTLANRGAFGVTPAVRDADGNVVIEGERVRSELGILLSTIYSATVMDNVNLTNSLNLYTDYINSFGNIDVDWELNLNFKVNNFVLAKLGSHLIYDDDVKITRTTEAGEQIRLGPRIQWKQQLGVGVIVEF